MHWYIIFCKSEGELGLKGCWIPDQTIRGNEHQDLVASDDIWTRPVKYSYHLVWQSATLHEKTVQFCRMTKGKADGLLNDQWVI